MLSAWIWAGEIFHSHSLIYNVATSFIPPYSDMPHPAAQHTHTPTHTHTHRDVQHCSHQSLAIIIVQQSGERSFLVIYFSVLSFLLAKHSYTLIQTHLCSLGVAGVGE